MVALCYAFNDHGISNKRNNIRNTSVALLFDHFLQLFTDLEKNAKILPSSTLLNTSMFRLLQRHILPYKTSTTAHLLDAFIRPSRLLQSPLFFSFLRTNSYISA